MRTLWALITVLAACSVRADSEAPNRPAVFASEYGGYYAKSIPEEYYGTEGTTRVYAVGYEEDVPVAEYPWYSAEIYMGGEGDAFLVRFGPWSRDREPREDHLAIGFYAEGKTLREYSTLEMAERGSGVSRSVSHYRVFGEREGFRWLPGTGVVFRVIGVSGTVFDFNVRTGELIP